MTERDDLVTIQIEVPKKMLESNITIQYNDTELGFKRTHFWNVKKSKMRVVKRDQR